MKSQGKRVVHVKNDSLGQLHIYYNGNRPDMVLYNGATYRYVHSLQGDILGLQNGAGNLVVEYRYDAWGRLLSKTGSLAATLGTLNPFRYRGYVYDEETSLYYLRSRYYNPNWCRFISSDSILGKHGALLQHNPFCYCSSSPVIRIDVYGDAWETVWDVISLGASIVDVASRPFDPWAWIGLAGDLADVLIPFVGGIGEATRVYKAASLAMEVGDTTVDGVKIGWKVGDDITALTKAGNSPSWSTLRNRYWKNKAFYFPEEFLDDSVNLERMQKGLAPIIKGEKMELHHLLRREGVNIYMFMEVTPAQHAIIDRFRHVRK